MSLDPRTSPTASPCRGKCTATSLGDAVCRGCGRTQDEVRDWNTYTDEQKLVIKARLCRHEWIFTAPRHIRCIRCGAVGRRQATKAERAEFKKGGWSYLGLAHDNGWRSRA